MGDAGKARGAGADRELYSRAVPPPTPTMAELSRGTTGGTSNRIQKAPAGTQVDGAPRWVTIHRSRVLESDGRYCIVPCFYNAGPPTVRFQGIYYVHMGDRRRH
ncbi:hypothetical protein DPEC_G00349150 [Dallia pectoralis]|uniref:Uncharacterized protein n=1 Tax=Dallia pectoralis TaxID=75939 RepID=A0ACC2F1P4_DALPE|nr:hypothetical protein DPEC_G00349150 [Dallia pectoralis]